MDNDKKRNKEVEIDIFNRFSRIVKEKFTSLADDTNNGGTKVGSLDELYKRPEFTAEKRILNELNSMGLHKGVMCGFATFAFLRFSPRAISRIFQRRAGVAPSSQGPINPFNQKQGYKFDNPNTPISAQPNLERPGLFFRMVRFSLDAFVSMSIGAYASLYFVDKNKMMEEFSDIPLIEGRSLLSEELCPDFMSEFQKLDPQIWDKNHPSLSGGSVHSNEGREEMDFRRTIQGFVVNCKRRAIYEEEMRSEQGMKAGEPVSIPPPGVPRDISVSLDDLLDDGGFGREDGTTNDDDYFDTYFDMDDDKQN